MGAKGSQSTGGGRFIARYAALIVRLRVWVVLFWVVAAVAAATLLPSVEQAGTGTLGDLVANDAEAIETEVRSFELFRLPLLSRTVVVERQRGGLSPDEVAAIYRRAGALGLGALPGLEGIAFALSVTDNLLNDTGGGADAALTYLFFPPEIGPVGRTGLAERLIEREISPSRESGVTGVVSARGEQVASIRDSLPLVELATVLLVALAVGLHFRSVVAPLANIFTVAVAYVVSVRLLGSVGAGFGISVPEEVEPVMVALLFGVVTDYVIFFLSRFRGALTEGLDAVQAAQHTATTLVPIISAAGISVAVAAGGLVAAQLGFFRAFGPGLAVAVLIALAVVITLVPALLALLGGRLLWPGHPGPPTTKCRAAAGSGGRPGLRARILRQPVRRPRLVVLLTALPLAGLSLLVTQLDLANTTVSGLPADSPPKQALRIVASEFPAGAIAPTVVLVEGDAITEKTAELEALGRALRERRNFARVIGPADVGEPVDLGATRSPTGNAVRFILVLDVDPLGARAIATVDRLGNDLPALLRDAGLEAASAALAGDTAISAETVIETREDLGRVLPIVALLVFAVLAVFLRALVAPFYLVLTSLLALGAALGLTVLVFEILLGYEALSFYVPFAGIVLLVALGSDYNVYLAGRVWDEARRRPLREAIEVASLRATSAITTAGIVLALSFAMLAIVPLRPFRELAFLLGTGLLVDAFVVRALLAPALMTIFGERSGWPGRRLGARGAAGESEPPERIVGGGR